LAQRTSKNRHVLTGQEVNHATGIHITDIGRTRDALVRRGLLLIQKQGRSDVYIVCDPTDRTPVLDSMATGLPIDLDRLSARVLSMYFRPLLAGCRVTTDGLCGRCPLPHHNDSTPSFNVSLAKGSGGVWSCMGCGKSGKLVELEMYLSEDASSNVISPQEAMRKVIGRLHSLGVREGTTGKGDMIYDYCDEEGEVISQVVRPGGDKAKTYQRRPNPNDPDRYLKGLGNAPRVLYRLTEVKQADLVILVEGEPDVEAVRALRLNDAVFGTPVAATTAPFGAQKWKESYSKALKGKTVICIPHNDEDDKGRKFMLGVADALDGFAHKVLFRELPSQFKDVDEFLNSQGNGEAEFIAMLDAGDVLEEIQGI
jgi:hypothetical protein